MRPDAGALQLRAVSQLGKPYRFGFKDMGPSPEAFDCSGFVCWVFLPWAKLPEGSYNQIQACDPVADGPQTGDLGFFKAPGESAVSHVVIYYGEHDGQRVVIEARGEPYDQVIFRPAEKWEKQPGFLGWHRLKPEVLC